MSDPLGREVPAAVLVAGADGERTAYVESAQAAGMSVDYVVRLEQGRSSQPSTQLLGALARALRLSDDERAHLFHLAGHRPPPADGVARLARAGLVRMLDLLGDTPALVLSDLGTKGWRLIYLIPVLGLPLTRYVARRLPGLTPDDRETSLRGALPHLHR